MTIQEAIKSGKPFKRKLSQEWYQLSPFGNRILYFPDKWFYGFPEFSVDDILAIDWEVKES